MELHSRERANSWELARARTPLGRSIRNMEMVLGTTCLPLRNNFSSHRFVCWLLCLCQCLWWASREIPEREPEYNGDIFWFHEGLCHVLGPVSPGEYNSRHRGDVCNMVPFWPVFDRFWLSDDLSFDWDNKNFHRTTKTSKIKCQCSYHNSSFYPCNNHGLCCGRLRGGKSNAAVLSVVLCHMG